MALLATVPFLTSCSPSEPPTFADYHVPTLDGWEKDQPDTKGFDPNSVTYRKTVGETDIRMKFRLIPVSDGEKPDDLEALKAGSQANLGKVDSASTTFKVLEQEETTFRTFPAYLTNTYDKIRAFERERKILRVGDGKNTFLIDQTLIGNPIDASARSEADAAWNKFSSELQIP